MIDFDLLFVVLVDISKNYSKCTNIHQDHGGMNTHHSHQEFKGNCMYFRILIFPCKLIILNGQYD